MSFHIGQKVVCVGFVGTPKPMGWWASWARRWGVTLAKRGDVYTVRDIVQRPDGEWRLRVVEIVNPIIPFRDAPDHEPWFWAEGFRPITERKTDISIFKRILADCDQRVDAPCDVEA